MPSGDKKEKEDSKSPKILGDLELPMSYPTSESSSDSDEGDYEVQSEIIQNQKAIILAFGLFCSLVIFILIAAGIAVVP